VITWHDRIPLFGNLFLKTIIKTGGVDENMYALGALLYLFEKFIRGASILLLYMPQCT
jgi:hypothetical protein